MKRSEVVISVTGIMMLICIFGGTFYFFSPTAQKDLNSQSDMATTSRATTDL